MKKVFVVGDKYPFISNGKCNITEWASFIHRSLGQNSPSGGTQEKKITDKFGFKTVIQAQSKNGNNDNLNKIQRDFFSRVI